MEHAGDDVLEAWPSTHASGSTPPTFLHSWTPTSSLTDYHRPGLASAGPRSWLQGHANSTSPFTSPAEALTEEYWQHQERRKGLQRNREPPVSPSNHTTPPPISSPTARGSNRRLSDTQKNPHLRRKNTKRRKTGPDRFDNYLHGNMPLPPDVTTSDVFQRYPNHVTDEDIEELWRLGSSARQISELMPQDTHYNSEGVLVQQHHSLIQKKFKTFKERHETHEQAIKGHAAQPEDQGLLGPSSSPGMSMQARQRTNSDGGQLALASTAPTEAVGIDLKFRCYPFNPPNDKAFEARMSIKMADMEPVIGYIAHEDHEVRILDFLIRRECQRHRDLLRHRVIQAQPWDFPQASLYKQISEVLLQMWPIPRCATPAPVTASQALRLLQCTIDQIYLHHPAPADPPATRPIFNFDHRDLRRWKVFARTLYYLVAITRTLEAGQHSSIPVVASGSSQRVSGRAGDVHARPRSPTMAASAQEMRPVDGRSSVRGSPSTAYWHGSSTATSRQPYPAFGLVTGAAYLTSPQASTNLGGSSSPATHRMSLTSPTFTVFHGGTRGPTTHNSPPPTQRPPAPAPPTDSFGPATHMTAYNLHSETKDYITFLPDGEESDEFMNQMIDWD